MTAFYIGASLVAPDRSEYYFRRAPEPTAVLDRANPYNGARPSGAVEETVTPHVRLHDVDPIMDGEVPASPDRASGEDALRDLPTRA